MPPHPNPINFPMTTFTSFAVFQSPPRSLNRLARPPVRWLACITYALPFDPVAAGSFYRVPIEARTGRESPFGSRRPNRAGCPFGNKYAVDDPRSLS
ncbi:MAG: hypothetical protein QOF48_3242 [Verrucomicrobiota bacterium]